MSDAKSFVFFDLETTGLPELEWFKTRITEISLVAVSKEHLLSTKFKDELPRVQHKLTLCVYPGRLIPYDTERITGLNNELLEKEKRFPEHAAEAIRHFLLHLQKPIVLIAHNGEKFDLPILQKEFERAGLTLPDDTLCVDSLPIFREIRRLEEQREFYDLIERDRIKTMAETELRKIQLEEEAMEANGETREKPNSLQSINETTPRKRTQPAENGGAPSRRLSREAGAGDVTPQVGPSEETSKKRPLTPPARKELFPVNGTKKKFTLSAVYERCFGMAPLLAHNAEGDVISLLKCAIAMKEEFIEQVETAAKPFAEVKPIGSK